MLEDLLPFIFMLVGMLAVGITLVVVAIRRSMEDSALPPEYQYLQSLDRRGTDSAVGQRADPADSAGRGSGFQG